MSLQGRIKNWFGGGDPVQTQTVASGGTISIAADQTFVPVSAAGAYSTATTVVFNNASKIRPGRQIIIYNAGTNTITIKATAIASALENYYSAAGDLSLTAGLSVTLLQLSNGAWTRVD